ncbi:MAG: ATP-binding protein [Candidatus Woesearchaeota archaeon]
MIKDVLILQKREAESKLAELYIERSIDIKKLDNPLIKVIIGPRRVGKSFSALHFLGKQKGFGYVNFDDEKLVYVKDYDEIISAMNDVYNNPKHILLDEIQNLQNWELFANRMQRQGYDVIITGSNSRLLSKELATHLTGRHVLINILPFSFKEYTKVENKALTTSEIKTKLDNYVLQGGYPEPCVKHLDYTDYLSTLFSSVIYKDIVKRYKIRFAQGLEEMAFYLLSNIASEYSYHSLSKMTKIQSVHTVKKYLGYLEEAFLFFSLGRFSYKVKEQLSSNKKVYCIDNGFIYSKAFKLSPDTGKLYENVVAIELKKEELNNKYTLYYWKNIQQEEVDFVIKEGTKVKQLIQVCVDMQNSLTKKRELRALVKAGNELRCSNLLVVTEDYETEEEFEWFGIKAKVKMIPLWKWLLGKEK